MSSLLFVFVLSFPLFSHASLITFSTKIDTIQERINVQIVLNEVMVPSPNLKIDGVLGKKSIQVIQAFQESHGLISDGKIGPITRSALENAQTSTNTQTSSVGVCAPGKLYNSDTGQKCTSATSTLQGCIGTNKFSTLTGQSCSTTTTKVVRSGGGGGGGSSSTNTTDTTKPTVISFAIPSTSSSLTVSISTFTATDNIGVTGYLLTETSSTPNASSGSWTSTPSTTYTFSSEGSKTLYAWAKDAVGNVSVSLSGAVLVTIEQQHAEADYFVATDGNDNNPGTFDLPFATWQKGFDIAQAGDLVYIRGGVYQPLRTTGNIINIADKHGTSGNMINIFAYPGEEPVMNGEGYTLNGFSTVIKLNNADYIHIKGLQIKNFAQPAGGGSVGVMLRNGSDHNILEKLDVSYIGGQGIAIEWEAGEDKITDNLFLNCDSHHNSDPLSLDPYGAGDGFVISGGNLNDHTNTLRGCRSWSNSDDGFDNWNENGVVLYDSDIAFHNGYIPDTSTHGGDGEGFKLGQTSISGDTIRKINNCISAYNYHSGFNSNDANTTGVTEISNALAVGNGQFGYVFRHAIHIIKNSIDFNNNNSPDLESNAVHNHNSWDSGLTVTSGDFIGLDISQLTASRQTDGSLQNILFGHLASGSNLINAGVDVGLPYFGTAPDIGAFESNY